MCGIIGYIGYRNASSLLLNGLKRMVYRGYDSAGITCLNNDIFVTKKDVGQITDINKKLDFSSIKGNIGIGHTRWATHGKVSKINTHPHFSCDGNIGIVHNGIVENFQNINKSLTNSHNILSETDTEIICHLFEEYYNKYNDEKKAVLKLVNKLEGAFSFVLINKHTGNLIGVRKDAPLILGVGHNEYFIASDILSFIDYTDNVIFLDNYEIVILNKNNHSIFNFKNNIVEKQIVKVAWEIGQISKKGFEHYTLKEIYDQKNSIINSINKNKVVLKQIPNLIKNSNKVFIVGSGSSYHVALIAKILLAKYVKINAEVILSSEFNQYLGLFDHNTVAIIISQSGETADILESVKELKKQKSKIISIVNAFGSSLVRESDYNLYLNCGPEIGVAATKSFTSQLVVIYEIISTLCTNFPLIKNNFIKKSVNEILNLETKIKNVINTINQKDVYLLGKGLNQPIALEGALKLKELSYIHAEGMSIGELKHGSLALIDNGTPVLILNPEDENYKSTLNNISEIKSRGGYIICISNKNDKLYDVFLPIPKTHDSLYPLLGVIPLQMLAYFYALNNQLDPDFPRNLAKSVTVK